MRTNEQRQHTLPKQCRPTGMVFLLLCAMISLFCACERQTEVVQPVITAVTYTDQPLPDLTALAEQKELLYVDLRGHDLDAAQIAALREALPACEVLWDIAIGGTRIDGDAESICLDTLTEADLELLEKFPNLASLDARGSDCAQALSLYAAEHPELAVLWSVQIAEVQVSNTDFWLDLSMQTLPETTALMECLDLMPQLTDVNLIGCEMSLEDKAKLQELYPDIRFYWVVEIDGKQFKNTETRVDLNDVNIADTEELALIVSCFQNPEKVDVSTLGFASVEMEELCRQFPETVFAWITMVGRHIIRTDATVFDVRTTRSSRLLRDEDIKELRFCTQLRAVNLGKQSITDISPLANLTNLEVLVISENQITDLSPLSGLKKLHYLEAYSNEIKDVSPLAALPQLYDLNLMQNNITDLSPLTQLTSLQRGYFSRNKLNDSASQKEMLASAFPDAQLNFTAKNQSGWKNHARYDKLNLIWETLLMQDLYSETTAEG